MKKFIFLLTAIANSSFVFSQDFIQNHLYYSIISGTNNVSIEGSINVYGDVIIPPVVTYNGVTYNVTSIGSFVFNDSDNMTSIIIPNTITSIGNRAFYSCNGLTSLVIPDSVISIGDEAFSACGGLNSIILSNSITSINNGLLSGCSNLTSVIIPDSVTSIGTYAFSSSRLNSITIPNSVTSIERGTFSGCYWLTSVIIPDSITSIERDAFSYCSNLVSVTIPNSVTSIKENTFYNCVSLISVIIPDSVTSIETFAFGYCYRLPLINIPNSVISIGNSAFYSCYGLTTLTIPDSVTSIGNSAFSSCSSLTSITCDITTPLVIDETVFNYLNYSLCNLTVPTASYNDYSVAPVWRNFRYINGVLDAFNYNIEDQLQLYPNPVKNELFINTQNLTNKKLDVFDSNGRVLFTQPLNDITTINTSSLTSGMYFFKITTDEGVITKKIIKN